jgi:hypothetical protein
MAFYSFVTNVFKSKKKTPIAQTQKSNDREVLSLRDMIEELGVRSETTIGTYQEEESPDNLTISDYVAMQNNDGTIRAITRLFSMPIQSTPIKIIPGKNDKGERDFIEAVFLGPQYSGGMSTPLPFVIADMTRAIFEGFRLYEKVPQIIENGKHKGLIGWKKLAPRDSVTLKLRADEKGGFLGCRQTATFGTKSVNVNIPPEKCILFTFQKERHFLYGESILKAAYYHYDKKHKLYYLAHKKAEIDAVGLKILKIGKPLSEAEVSRAETAVEQIGVNSRITLPPGFELDIDRSPTGYDVLKLIEHHDTQIALSTLTQATQMGTKSTYNYTYGRGYDTQSSFIVQMLQSVMKSMEDTLNEWAVAPLIDWNFNSGSYPKIKLMPLQDTAKQFLMSIFETLIKKDPAAVITPAFASKLADEVAINLGLEVKVENKQDALKAFESGKKAIYDTKKLPAKTTPDSVKKKVKEKAISLSGDTYFLEKFEAMGKRFALAQINKEK